MSADGRLVGTFWNKHHGEKTTRSICQTNLIANNDLTNTIFPSD